MISCSKYQASSGDTAQSDTAVENNDVPERIPEEEDEQEMLNVQNNDDVTGESVHDKDLVQEGEGALDVRTVQNEHIKKEQDGKQADSGQEDVNKDESKEVKTHKR